MQRARVNLRRDAGGELVLTITGALEPSTSAVLAKLPKTAFRGMDRWRRSRLSRQPMREVVSEAISYGTSIETVSNAIAAAILETQIANGEGFTSEAPLGLEGQDLLVAGSPALLAVGTGLFQLTPIGVIDGAKGLKTLREKARRQVAAEAAALKANAEQEAARIVQRAAEIEHRARESAQELVRSPLGRVPTDIMAHYPLRSNPLSVGVHLDVVVTEFVKTLEGQVKHWAASEALSATTLLWVPFDPATGTLNVRNSRVDAGAYQLPHASHGGTCVDLAREPRPFTSCASVEWLQQQLQGAFRVVNLSSLLLWPRHGWHPVIKSVCPPDVLKAADERVPWGQVTTRPTSVELVGAEAEGDEEWQVARVEGER